jgi:hypothetical protein
MRLPGSSLAFREKEEALPLRRHTVPARRHRIVSEQMKADNKRSIAGFEAQRRLRRGRTPACAISLTSCPDSEERTGIRFEKERVHGYSGGAKALPGRPLAPAIAIARSGSEWDRKLYRRADRKSR